MEELAPILREHITPKMTENENKPDTLMNTDAEKCFGSDGQ